MGGFDKLASALQDSVSTKQKKKPILEPDETDQRVRRAKIDTLYTVAQRAPSPSDRRRGVQPDPKDDADYNRLSGDLGGKLGWGEYLSMMLRKPNTGPRK